MIVGILALLFLIFVTALSPAQWEFGLEVETEIAQIHFQPGVETRWRIDGAVVCSRLTLPLPERFQIADPHKDCGSRTWRGWQIDAPEQVVVIHGGGSAVLETTGGRLSMSLRTNADSLGTLSVVGLVDTTALGDSLNLLWSTKSQAGMTFPFSGTTTLGRAVNWSDPRMLRAGKVAVYTADESADQRTLVDEAELMLGDQVRLGTESDEIWPKGFIRAAGDVTPMQVVAFGRADSLRIERFGESGYDFKPGYVAKVASDPGIALWGSILIAYMSLVLGLLQVADGEATKPVIVPARYRYVRWLLKSRPS